MKRFFIMTNREKDPMLETTDFICEYLNGKGAETIVCSMEWVGKTGSCPEIPERTECILVLGGDGTLLQAARDTVCMGIPLLGINLGTIGFLAEVEKNGIEEALEQLVNDDYELQDRMLLTGKVLRDGREICSSLALNDVVVNRSGPMAVLSYEVYVNGQKLNRYQADGMIVATPTGSTGYSMSAGGPIVEPGAKLMVMTPICPHTLHTRSIVLSAEDTVELVIDKGRREDGQEAEINFDGGLTRKLYTGDRVYMQKSEQTVKLIRLNKVSFLETLHKKMSEN